jgi:hypothetical protein
MCETSIEMKSRVKRMTDREISNELYGMRVLAISVFRNDEGTKHDEEYRSFYQYLRFLKKEAARRGIPARKLKTTIPTVIA